MGRSTRWGKSKMHDSAYIRRQECGKIVVAEGKGIHFSVDIEHSKVLHTYPSQVGTSQRRCLKRSGTFVLPTTFNYTHRNTGSRYVL